MPIPIINPFTRKQQFSDDLMLRDIMKESTGFENRTDSSISFDNGTRTFTIQPVSDYYRYAIAGKLYTKREADALQIFDTEGLHAIYFDGLDLAVTENPSLSEVEELIRTYPIITYIYWDATNKQQIYFAKERHLGQMDGSTHANLHKTRGTQFSNGLALNTFDIDGTGDDNTNAQFGVDAGGIIDEDLFNTISAIASTTGLPVYYKDGASGNWRREIITGYSVLNALAGRVYWNEFTGGAWQRTEVANNDFVNIHAVAINDNSYGVIAIMGQADYGNIVAARNGAQNEINQLITDGLPFEEALFIGTAIAQSSDGYGNAVKMRIRSTGDAESPNYVDFRGAKLSPASAGGSHANLSDRSLDAQHPASAIKTDTTNFDNQLSSADDDVQTALETLDDSYRKASVVLDNTDLNGLFVPTTIDLIPAPGAGKIAIVEKMMIEYDYDGSTVFTADATTQIALGYSGGQDVVPIGLNGVVTETNDEIRIRQDPEAAYIPAVNTKLRLIGRNTATTGGGNSTLTVTAWYRIIDSNL